MSISSGFFNSVKGDRKYNAEQMSAIFDGIINDGVFANVGTAFTVSAVTGNIVRVGIGRAWFNSTWIYNDAVLSITADDSDVLLDRYDALVIEVDRTETVRNATVHFVKGTATSEPKYPSMIATASVHQYPLAYIHRKAGSTEITQSDIISMIGTSSCPYVTGILQVQNIDNIVAQWKSQWYDWTNEQRSVFNTWFNAIKVTLDGDVAANLAARITAIESGDIPIGNADTVDDKHATDFTNRLPDQNGGTGTAPARSLLAYINEQVAAGVKSAEFSYFNISFTEKPEGVSDYGVVRYIRHVDDYITVWLVSESSTTQHVARFIYKNTTFSTAWKKVPYSDEVMLLNKGGTVTGQISVRNAVNGYGTMAKNNSATADYGTDIRDVTSAGVVVKLTITANSNKVFFTNTANKQCEILHRGNSVSVNISEEAPSDTLGLWVY